MLVHQRVTSTQSVPFYKILTENSPASKWESTWKRTLSLEGSIRSIVEWLEDLELMSLVSENVVYPIVPNGFADHYPVFKWLFHWYTQHFQTKPCHLSSVFISFPPVAWRHHTSCFVAAPLTLCASQCNDVLWTPSDVNRVKGRSQDKPIPKYMSPKSLMKPIWGDILLPRCKSSRIHF